MKKRICLYCSFIYTLVLLLSTSLAEAKIDTTATWTFKTGGPVYSSPTCSDGSVFIGSDDGKMYCLDGESGDSIWTFATGGFIRCKPAISNSALIFESEDGYVYAIDKNSGNKIWNTYVGNTIDKRVLPDASSHTGNSWDYMQSSACIDSGTVYIGSGDSTFYAMNSQTGAVRWSVKTGNVVRSSACVVGSIVYVGSWDGYIYAFNKADGSVFWKYNAGGHVQESPRVFNGILYCGQRGGYVNAIDANLGTLIWRYYYGSSAPFVESSVAYANGIIYVGSSDLRTVFAFNALTGEIKWTSNVPGDTWSSPFLLDSTLYIGCATYGPNMTSQVSGGLLALKTSTGEIKWKCNTGTTTFIGGVISSPTVDKNLIYYGSVDGSVYAVDTAFMMSPKWSAADFSSQTTDGKEGFYVPSWASGSLSRVNDRTAGKVLQSDVSISLASPFFAAQRDYIPLQSGEFKARNISFSIKLTSNFPDHGLVKFYLVNSVHDSIATIDTINTQVKIGQWTDLWLPGLDSIANAGSFDRSKPASIGVAVYYPAPYNNTVCTGSFYLDNLCIYGISFPSSLPDGVTEKKIQPRSFILKNNYPNPFNPMTTIEYQVAVSSHITLTIFDILGREVSVLVDGMQKPGTYKAIFDGSKLSSGVYFDRLKSGTTCETKTLLLIK